MSFKNHKSGFTLIELLVVIAIISVLTSIVLASLATSKQKGSDAAKIEAVQEVRSAINTYYSDNGYYPTGSFASSVTDLTAALVPKYISLIDANIKYQGVDKTGAACNAAGCSVSYHLGIPLARTDNTVLKIDSDTGAGSFDGSKDNCTSGGTASNPDLCYDVIP